MTLNFKQIFKQCPKLESLQLSGGLMAKPFFENLALSLPAAANLRDLLRQAISELAFFFLNLIFFSLQIGMAALQ